MNATQVGFQIDACSYVSDWLILVMCLCYWLRAPLSEHLFEIPSQYDIQLSMTSNWVSISQPSIANETAMQKSFFVVESHFEVDVNIGATNNLNASYYKTVVL